jgi:LysM repeat protein
MARQLIFMLLVLCLLPFTVLAQDSQSHTVQPGETLFRISQRYGVSVDALAQANGITDVRRIYAGQVLVIPDANTSGDFSAPVVQNSLVAGETAYHTVQRGETLATIARRYNMTVDQLIQLNNLTNPNRILTGQQLTIIAPVEGTTAVDPMAPASQAEIAAAAPAQQTTHTVRPGEYLSQIARMYGVDWNLIAVANGIATPDQIYAGQVLIIPNATTQPVAVSDPGILTVTAPPAVVLTGRSIIVDLSDSRAYAYENGTPVYSALASTGLPATPTVLGDYAVYRKLESQTMSGPGYYLPGVPYILYFYQGYALHGTYWHENFGRPMSHGCVNLRTEDALWFYNFADIGTPVHVQS